MLTRTDLFRIARANGWRKGAPLSANANKKIRGALKLAITDEMLATAPKYHFSNAGIDSTMPMTREKAIDLLMEEVV